MAQKLDPWLSEPRPSLKVRMNRETTKLLPRNVRVAEAFRSYDADEIRVVNRSLSGASHVISTRRGLYAANDHDWWQIAHGFFFGVTLRNGDIYAFESCDQPRSVLRRGRVVRFCVANSSVAETEVLAKGLDNGCHQIDFLGDQLHVVDTYNQKVVRFESDFSSREVLSPLPTCEGGRWTPGDPQYGHVNSLLRVADANLLLLHNNSEHTGRKSEVAAFDNDWKELWRVEVDGRSCHDLVLIDQDALLLCDSTNGDVISADGTLRVRVTPHFSRGLAIDHDSIVVGGSARIKRTERLDADGTVTFMDRQFKIRSTISFPGSPMTIRSLAAVDYGISNCLSDLPYTHSLSLDEVVGLTQGRL